MGKGGRSTVVPSTTKIVQTTNKDGHWVSPYNPLDPNAPALPSKGEIKAVIPKECFHRSYFHSMYFVVRDTLLAAGCVYAANATLSTDLPSDLLSLDALQWFAGWNVYAFWMGCVLTGHWVLAHECGHGAFSPSQTFNDAWGFVMHQALLVPYFAWQYTHAKHHRRTNNTVDGESHVPNTRDEVGLGANCERESAYAIIHEAIGDGPFGMLQVVAHLVIGWPAYLLIGATGGPDRGMTNHYFPYPLSEPKQPKKELFPGNWKEKVYQSDIGVAFVAAGALSWAACNGIPEMMALYGGPLIVVNAWLVLYTW